MLSLRCQCHTVLASHVSINIKIFTMTKEDMCGRCACLVSFCRCVQCAQRISFHYYIYGNNLIRLLPTHAYKLQIENTIPFIATDCAHRNQHLNAVDVRLYRIIRLHQNIINFPTSNRIQRNAWWKPQIDSFHNIINTSHMF